MFSGTKAPRRLRLSYASVTATAALFVSLGGASYAAFSLPAHSVGSRELRAGAVDTRALAFPLGATSVTSHSPEDLSKGGCNGALRPGEIPPPCAPTPGFGGPEGTLLHAVVRHPGHLLISVTAGLINANAAPVAVSFAVIFDQRAVGHGKVMVAGNQQEQVPIQALVHAGAALHTVGFQITAQYSSYTPGDVVVDPVSVLAVSLP